MAKDTDVKLLKLAGKWLKENGGGALVAGPICVIQMPGSVDRTFYVAVQMLGHMPKQVGEDRP